MPDTNKWDATLARLASHEEALRRNSEELVALVRAFKQYVEQTTEDIRSFYEERFDPLATKINALWPVIWLSVGLSVVAVVVALVAFVRTNGA